MPLPLALLLAAQLPAYGLPPDPALDRPLPVEARIEPLPDLLVRLGKDLGTPLTVERRMEGLKATIFTPARPAWLTLAGLASVFNAEWTAVEGGGYRLSETVPARNRREAQLELEDRDRRERVKTFLEEGGFGTERVNSGDSKTSGQVAMESGYAGAEAAIRRLYRSLGPLDREKFWRGEPMHLIGETPGEPGEIETTEIGPGVTQMRIPRPPGRMLVLVRTRRSEGGIRFVTFSPIFSGSSAQALPNSKVVAELLRSAFQKAQDAWGPPVQMSDAPELERALQKFEAAKRPWSGEQWTETDLLESIYRATGIPIIAEAFRRSRPAPELPERGTLREALRRTQLGSAVRFENGMLLRRPGEFWRYRGEEPSEAALLPLESAPSTPPEALLDAAAETCSALSPEALNLIGQFAARRDLDRLERGAWALRLWGRLGEKERNAALRPEGLPLSRASADARATLREVVTESLLRMDAELLVGNDAEMGAPGRHPRARRVESVLKLLDLAPAGALTLRAGRSSRSWTSRRHVPSSNRPPDQVTQLGLALQITDPEGYGIRLFAPQPNSD